MKIKNATKKGYLEAKEGDGIDISSRMHHHRGTVQKDKAQTLTCESDVGVVVKPHVIGGIGEKKSNSGTQYYLQDRIYEGDVATTTTTHESFQPNYQVEEENELRIRKLTPRECFRLMGVKDEDSNKLNEMSDMVKYHLSGDSIITTVLMAIFGEMLGVNWKEKVEELLNGLANDGKSE